ncbi:PaaI family thioesterase [Actinomadura sp. SCN-SB]|uniref:PaaI family thioesterase n=1 Tax=Actinomadura sp. SCN-SB TaxID=3373092 RepID=UPI003750DC70
MAEQDTGAVLAGTGDARVAALSALADRVRELTEAVLFTDAPPAEVAAASAELEALTARLSASRRPGLPDAVLGPDGMPYQPAGPVTGALNPIAPPVEFTADPNGTVRSTFTLSAVYEGPPSYVHGGVSAMILDHLLGMAAAVNGTPGMTATLDLRYRRPTPLNVPLTVEGRVTRTEGRRTWADGWIRTPDSKTTVEATAMFISPKPPAPAPEA